MFEKKREKITLFTDISITKYYIFIYIVLAITKNFIFLKKKQRFKQRLYFSLFKKRAIWSQYKNKDLRFKHYLKSINFILYEKGRFLAYCDLVCEKFQRTFLASLLKAKPMFQLKKTNFFDIPFRLKVKNFFSVLDRNYSYI